MSKRVLRSLFLMLSGVFVAMSVPMQSMDWGFSRAVNKEQLKDVGANSILTALACGILLAPCCPKMTVCGGALTAGAVAACGTGAFQCPGAHHILQPIGQMSKEQLKEVAGNGSAAALLCALVMLPCCPKATVCYGALAAGTATGCGTAAYQQTPAYCTRRRVDAFFERIDGGQAIGDMSAQQLSGRLGTLTEIHEELMETEDMCFCLGGDRRRFRNQRMLCKQMQSEAKERQRLLMHRQRIGASAVMR